MRLKRIRAHNFRTFGDGKEGHALDWELSPTLNILVGENDAGKSSVIDAIRHVLWTTSFEFVRLFETDFHVRGSTRTDRLFIEATLVDLSTAQEAAVIDWITYEADGSRSLIIHLQATWIPPQINRRGRVSTVTRAGLDGNGPEIGSAVRELIRATYLKPLRDAEDELSPGRQSRLSQILSAHPGISGQEVNDFDSISPLTVPKNLVGLMAFTQHHIGTHKVIKDVERDINDNYLKKFAFAGDQLSSRVQIAPDLELQPILEKFELGLLPSSGIHPDEKCARGLGYNNALFMATELVLLRGGDELGLLLVEEPEAHLHPQLQERVQELFTNSTRIQDNQRPIQIVMTTHSPSLAAGADISCMTLVHKSQLFSLAHEKTKLKKSDYEFLRRFIDATKANLFFARGVVIVEGAAEAILLPAIAKACGLSFNEYGISIVNVGSIGLYHYARILQRADDSVTLPIPVVCLTDLDVVPDEATYVTKPKKGKRFASDYTVSELEEYVRGKEQRAEGGSTLVCVSNCWTLEFDLAMYGLDKLIFVAIHLAKKADSKGEGLEEVDEAIALAEAEVLWEEIEKQSLSKVEVAVRVYQPLYEGEASKAVTAQYAAYLLETKNYGDGKTLYDSLPPYLQTALKHLTNKAKTV